MPTDPAEIRKSIGGGWWKYDLKAAEQLMLEAGMKRDGSGTWQLPDGSPFKVPMMSMNETNPTMNRVPAWWLSAGRNLASTRSWTRDTRSARMRPLGNYSANLAWTIETWGGHPDLSFFLASWHSKFYKPSGEQCSGQQQHALEEP